MTVDGGRFAQQLSFCLALSFSTFGISFLTQHHQKSYLPKVLKHSSQGLFECFANWSRPEKVDKKGVKVSTPVKNIFFGILGFILFNIEREP